MGGICPVTVPIVHQMRYTYKAMASGPISLEMVINSIKYRPFYNKSWPAPKMCSIPSRCCHCVHQLSRNCMRQVSPRWHHCEVCLFDYFIPFSLTSTASSRSRLHFNSFDVNCGPRIRHLLSAGYRADAGQHRRDVEPALNAW